MGCPAMEAKRVLWLLNHKLLMQSEIPLLRKLGYEVYTPKIPPFDVDATVDWESDKLLSIPKEDLDTLNQVDFYEKRLTLDEARLVNRYFQTAMFTHIPAAFESLVDYFKGILMLRSFARPEEAVSCSDVILSEFGLFTMTRLESTGSRFVFAEAYRGLSDIECRFFQDHALYAPIGIPDARIQDTWTGNDKKVLFVCPQIKVSRLYENQYQSFRKDFDGIPYAIGGVQPIAMESEKNIVPFLPDDRFDAVYSSYKCLFYSDQDCRQSIYPPIDAIRCGMPVVFMAGGLLDKVGGKTLPGRCLSIKEARRKVARLLSGDKGFAKKLRRTQGALLDEFAFEHCYAHWSAVMEEVENRRAIKQIPLFGKAKKRIAVLLQEGFTGGVLDYTIRLVYALNSAIKSSGDPIELVFGHLEHADFEDRDYFKPIRDMGIPIRKFLWKTLPLAQAQDILKLKGLKTILPDSNYPYIVPNDGISYFSDCDFLLFSSDRFTGWPLLLQPYGVIVHDFVQRFVPGIVPELIEIPIYNAMRSAKAVYTTTPVTMQCAVQYGGVSSSRIHLIPLLYSVTDYDGYNSGVITKKPYFLWCTNLSPHKMHFQALQALSLYYSHGGKLLCLITGTDTEKLAPGNKTSESAMNYDYINRIHSIVKNDTALIKNLKFMGNMPRVQYEGVLSNAKFLFHPGAADNGNFAMFDAAWKGIPTLSNDYMAIRYSDDLLHFGIRYFDVNDVDSITEALFDAERNLDSYIAQLPSKDDLFLHTVQCKDIADEVYQIIIAHAGIAETGHNI